MIDPDTEETIKKIQADLQKMADVWEKRTHKRCIIIMLIFAIVLFIVLACTLGFAQQ